MATTTTTRSPYQADTAKMDFRNKVSELLRKRKDPNYVRYAFEQMGYDTAVVDEELARLQSVQTGQPIQKPSIDTNVVPGTNIDQTNLTAAQQTALLYGQRTYQSGKILDTLDNSIASKDTFGAIKQKIDEMNVGGTITNQFVGEDFQKYDQAKRDFVNATLRRESGAVISPTEFENAQKQYFPVPGDSPEVVAQKKANRELVTRGLLSSAGVDPKEINFGETNQTGGQLKLNSPEEAKKWLDENPSDPRADVVRKKLESVGFLGANAAQESGAVSGSTEPKGKDLTDPQKQEKMFSDLKKAGDFLGITKFAQGIGVTLFLNSKEGKKLQKDAENGDKIALETLQGILNEAPSAKEVIGSAALTALNTVTAGIGTAASATGKVAQGVATGYAYDVAGDLEKDKTLKEAATPGVATATAGVLSSAGVITNWVGKKGQRGAERIYNSTVKPNIEDTKKAILYNGKTLGRKLLDEGLAGGDEKLLMKANVGLQSNEKKLQTILSKSKEVIKREELVPYLENLKSQLMNTPTPRAQKALEQVDEALNLLPENFDLSKANELKRSLYRELGDLAYKLDPNLSGSAETSKSIASGLKELIEKKSGTPVVAELNQKLSTFYQLQDGVLDNLARRTRNNLAGVGTLGALIEKTIGSPAVKTYGAKIIDRASKKLQSLGTGVGGKLTKAMIMNAIREAQDEEKATR